MGTHVVMRVKGMSCNHCVGSIKGALSEVRGVKVVDVNLQEGTVEVDFNEDVVNINTITEAIEEQGYDVVNS